MTNKKEHKYILNGRPIDILNRLEYLKYADTDDQFQNNLIIILRDAMNYEYS